MIPARTIRGRVAVVKWSYFNAGAVEGYTVTHDKREGWTVTASFVPGAVDPFKMAQRPLFFVAPFKRGSWRWEIRTLTMLDAGRFIATLGPMSEESANGFARPTT